MDKLLEVSGLDLKVDLYRILYDLDFFVGTNEIVAIIGENGSGKTMTLRSIVGLEDATVDKLQFKNDDLDGLPPHKRVEKGLSYCPSEAQLFPEMSVKENLEMGKYLYPEEVDQSTRFAYELFPDLRRLINRQASKLSGGERQMVALSKALMVHPDLLLLDEFSLGLARGITLEFSEKIKEVFNSGTSVLFVEQNIHLAAELAQRDYYMIEGAIEKRNVLPKSNRKASVNDS
ncbi:ATP-binding cassette domain-containing protein [Candidatus Bipolaricaulota bacterium]|nr:ATP-binding cassette domain-containing protein [Candidatus Bipolaricaulota bacterium]